MSAFSWLRLGSRKALVVGIGIVGASLLGDTTVAVADDNFCPSGYACVWTWLNFTGNKFLIGAGEGGTGTHYFANYKYSMKNRYTNKTICLLTTTNAWNCYSPGQNGQTSYPWYAYVVY
jgi:hypothetical protein